MLRIAVVCWMALMVAACEEKQPINTDHDSPPVDASLPDQDRPDVASPDVSLASDTIIVADDSTPPDVPCSQDTTGPKIVIKSHWAGSLIGGVITVVAEVTDPCGVDASTVRARVGKGRLKTVKLVNTVAKPSSYSGKVDTHHLSLDFYALIYVEAMDKLGNTGHVGITTILDREPPRLELDPPEDCYRVQKAGTKHLCSRPFDPVGPDAVDDLMQVPRLSKVRARVEEQGQQVPYVQYLWASGIQPKSVYLYVLDDVSKVLVVDSDGDGYCDSINPEVEPKGTLPGRAIKVGLAPITPGGSADFRPPGTGGPVTPPSYCHSWGTNTTPPTPLCKTTTASIVIPHSEDTPQTPSIYSIPPTSFTSCLGKPLDFKAHNISDGWACLAVIAKDNLGAAGISPPMRLYVNNSPTFLAPTTKLPAKAGIPPDCTGTLNKITGKVDVTQKCKYRNPREGSHPTSGKYVCKSFTTAKSLNKSPQMFCHNEQIQP